MSDEQTDLPNDSAERVRAFFQELAPERASRLQGDRFNSETQAAIAAALTPEYGEDKAQEIAFHLADWNADAAFLVALHLFPERFSAEEIADGVLGFLVHAPNHIAAAAALSGYPVEDIFEVAPNETDD